MKQREFGSFGGKFVPETLMEPILELEEAYEALREDPEFVLRLESLLKTYVGRETPLSYASRLTRELGGAKVFLKREDLNHTGAHKINNALGQALLAQRMGKSRIIAETGAGQHGVASASVAALLGMECVVFMGRIDMERQSANVQRMKLLGARVVPVTSGSETLKDAVSESMREWVSDPKNSYYLLGSALGPHPYPTMVRDFQSVIGREARAQFENTSETEDRLPTELVACVGGGSNAIGLFYPFLKDEVRMTGVEAGGRRDEPDRHAARFQGGRPGVFQGTRTYLLQDNAGQILETHSVSAGLDYAAVGPEHAFLHDSDRVQYTQAYDDEALDAFRMLCRTEGIIPALESSHALAYVMKRAPQMGPNESLLVCLSGRGDKDLHTVMEAENA